MLDIERVRKDFLQRYKEADSLIKKQSKTCSNWIRKQYVIVFRIVAETRFVSSGLLLIASVVVWLAWHFGLPNFGSDYRVEFVGLIFDIVFILIILSFLQYGDQRRQDIARQRETIEDYKRWDSEEARFRLAGALRRLNRLNVTAVNFAGIKLSNFMFAEHGIRDITNSTFYDGSWGDAFSKGDVNLQNVSFDNLLCEGVNFSPFHPLQGISFMSAPFASFMNCSFIECNLQNSSFTGAHLVWSEPPPDSLHEDLVDDEDGNPIYIQTQYSPFYNTDLDGVSFRYVHFENADFRDALNIDKADFTNARGLDTCIFDRSALKNDVLRNASLRIDG